MKLPLWINETAHDFELRDAENKTIATATWPNDFHAIVRAVNALPACVAAMEAAENAIWHSESCIVEVACVDESRCDCGVGPAIAQLRLALAAAKDGA